MAIFITYNPLTLCYVKKKKIAWVPFSVIGVREAFCFVSSEVYVNVQW